MSGASSGRRRRGPLAAVVCAAPLWFLPGPGAAHPHVFVDGGAAPVFDAAGRLEALAVTWRYDAFETLYILAAQGVLPDPDGSLRPEDRARLAAAETDWLPEFEGAAHLSLDGAQAALSRPRDAAVRLAEGRLELTFRRDLAAPTALAGRRAEIAFYEASYFYAYALTDAPDMAGAPAGCRARIIPFDPDRGLAALQTTLSALGREETPEDPRIGRLFADRMVLTCD